MEYIKLIKKDCGQHYGEQGGPCAKCSRPERMYYNRDAAWVAMINNSTTTAQAGNQGE